MQNARRQNLFRQMSLRICHYNLGAAFEQWRWIVQECRVMCAKTKKVLVCWRNKASLSCLHAWHEFTLGALEKQSMMQRAALRVMGSLLARTFHCWHCTTFQLQRVRTLLSRALLRRSRSLLARGCCGWREYAACNREARNKIRRAARHAGLLQQVRQEGDVSFPPFCRC